MNKIKLKLSQLLLFFVLSVPFVMITNKTIAQIPSSYENGHFYRDNSNGAVYWYAFGKLRHVQSPLTLKGLFTNATKPENMFFSNALGPNAPYGEPLTSDNGLINDKSTGKVYFRRQNYIYWISSPAVFNQLHFSWAAITNVANISGYTLCDAPPIPQIGYVHPGCTWK